MKNTACIMYAARYLTLITSVLAFLPVKLHHRQTSNMRRILVGYRIVGSLRCSWSIACRRCANYIFILDLTPGFKGLRKDNCKTRREAFKCWDLVRFMLEVWWYTPYPIEAYLNRRFWGRIQCAWQRCDVSVHGGTVPNYGNQRRIQATHLPLVPHICVNELGQNWFG